MVQGNEGGGVEKGWLSLIGWSMLTSLSGKRNITSDAENTQKKLDMLTRMQECIVIPMIYDLCSNVCAALPS